MKDSVTFGVVGISYAISFTLWHLTYPDLHMNKMGYWYYLLAVALWAGILASSLLTLKGIYYSKMVLGILGSCSVILYYSTLTGLKPDPESPLRPENNILSQFVMAYLLVSQFLGQLLNLYILSKVVTTLAGHIPGLWDAVKKLKFPSVLFKQKQAEIECLLDSLELRAKRLFDDSWIDYFGVQQEESECDKNLSHVLQLEEEIQALFDDRQSVKEDCVEDDLISTKYRADKFESESIETEPELHVKTLRDLVKVAEENGADNFEAQETYEQFRTELEVNRRVSDGKESNLSDSFEIMDTSL